MSEETVIECADETVSVDPRTDAKPTSAVRIAPVDLGPVHVETPVVLSPMAGVTNWPFRVLCEEYGPDGLYVAEMITARALVARNPKALRLCRFAPGERIRSLQLYGVNPGIVEQAARIVVDEDMADHVDLNFGCPVPKVTRRGGGSALPWKTDLFREIIQRVVRVCDEANIPVTAKIRVGIDHDHETFHEAGHIAQEEGCKAVTLHARTTAEYYGGHSDWSRIGELVSELYIPVFGNGDIWGADDALAMVEQTGCAGVAIGAKDIPAIVEFVRTHPVDFAVVAPDDPLVLGAVDALEAAGVLCFGPTKDAAAIEGSKVFAKDLMRRYGIPTASYEVFYGAETALSYVETCPLPTVVKADGLALGKGVLICETREEARQAVRSLMEDKIFGQAMSDKRDRNGGSGRKAPRELNTAGSTVDQKRLKREREQKKKSRVRKIIFWTVLELFTLCLIFGYGFVIRTFSRMPHPEVNRAAIENETHE